MADREKVIKGLECCSKMAGTVCRTCPYANECEESDALLGGAAHLSADALELLKAQEARVMTLKEIQHWDAAVFMDENRNPMCIKMLYCYELGSGKTIYHGYTFVDSDGDKIFFPAKDFGKNWRCWTSRPTEEQREAVKWE